MPRNGYPKPRSEPEREFSARGATAESYNLRGQAEPTAEYGAEYQVAPGPTGIMERPPTEPYPGPFTGDTGEIEAPGIGTANGPAIRRPYPEGEGEYPGIGIGPGWPPRYFQQPGRDDDAPQPPVAPAPVQPGPTQPPTDKGDWEDQETYVGECQCELYVGWGPDALARQNMTAYVGKPFYMRFTVFGNSTETAAWQVGYNRLGKLPGDGGLGFFLPNQEEMAKSPKNYASGGNVPGVSRSQDAPCDLTREYWVRPRKPGKYSLWGTWGSLVCEVVVEVLDTPPPERPPEPPAESDCVCTAFALVNDDGTPCTSITLESPTQPWKCKARMMTQGPAHLEITYKFEIVDEAGQQSSFIAHFGDGMPTKVDDALCNKAVEATLHSSRHDEESAGISQARGGFGGTPVAQVRDTRTGTCTVRGYINDRLCGTATVTVELPPCHCKLACLEPNQCAAEVILESPASDQGEYEYRVTEVPLKLTLGGNKALLTATITSKNGYLEFADDCNANPNQMWPRTWAPGLTCSRLMCNTHPRVVIVRPSASTSLIAKLLDSPARPITETVTVTLSNGAKCSADVPIRVRCDQDSARAIAEIADKSLDPPTLSSMGAVLGIRTSDSPLIHFVVKTRLQIDVIHIPPNCCCMYVARPVAITVYAVVNASAAGAEYVSVKAIESILNAAVASTAAIKLAERIVRSELTAAYEAHGIDGVTWPTCAALGSPDCAAASRTLESHVGRKISHAMRSYFERLSAIAAIVERLMPAKIVAGHVGTISWIPKGSLGGVKDWLAGDKPPPTTRDGADTDTIVTRGDNEGRFSNYLHAWISTRDNIHIHKNGWYEDSKGHYADAWGGHIGEVIFPTQRSVRITRRPDGVHCATFRQIVGAKTVRHLYFPVPGWAESAPPIWTVLELTLCADGQMSTSLIDHSWFPQHRKYSPADGPASVGEFDEGSEVTTDYDLDKWADVGWGDWDSNIWGSESTRGNPWNDSWP